MRLVLMIPTLDRSGAEKQFTRLACGIKRRTDWDVRVIALTRGGPYQDELERAEIPVRVLHKRSRFDPWALFRLRRELKAHRPDLLHTWLFAANAYGRLASGRSPGYPVVVSERCVDSWKSGWQLRFDRRLIGRTSRLLANSAPVAAFYRDVGYPADRVSVIPNGVEPLEREESLRSQLRMEWQLPQDARVVGYLGRLARQKRLKDLIWGFQLLRQLTDNVYFVIAGEGSERADLEHYARQMNCADLMRFVGQQSAGARVLSACDLFWLGSEFEGLPNSLMEAMSMGLPCVASDIPPHRELILDGQTGELFPLGDSVALAQFSDRILNDRGRAAELGEAARNRMRAEFSFEAMIERHLECYRDLLRTDTTATPKAGC